MTTTTKAAPKTRKTSTTSAAPKKAPKKTAPEAVKPTLDLPSLLGASIMQGLQSEAGKVVSALLIAMRHKGTPTEANVAQSGFGIDATGKALKENAQYNRLKGFRRHYVLPFAAVLKQLPDQLIMLIETLETPTPEAVMQQLSIYDFGANGMPESKQDWIEFCDGFAKTEAEKVKQTAPSKQAPTVTVGKPQKDKKQPSAGGREKGPQNKTSTAAQVEANKKAGEPEIQKESLKETTEKTRALTTDFNRRVKELGVTTDLQLKLDRIFKETIAAIA